MYGHHVIEDLKLSQKQYSLPEPGYKHAMSLVIDSIKNAQHFHLGSFQEFITPLDKIFHDECRAFFGECGENIRLPYKTCWFEFEDIVPGLPIEEDVPKRGVLTMEMDKDFFLAWIISWPKTFKRWVLSPQMYFVTIGKNVYEHDKFRNLVSGFMGKSGLPVSSLPAHYESNIFPLPLSRKFGADEIIGLAGDDQRDLVALNAALMLLSCKNVTTEENLPPAKLNKKRKKNGKPELFVYKTLKLVLPSGTSSQKEYLPSGEKVKIHLCRGHFKNYTKDSPLFGRYTGLYWWQAHIRGDKNEGIVVKDYALSSGKNGI